MSATRPGPADAIVVMGAAQYDGRPSPIFAARLDHAIALYKSGLAKWLVVTGGKAEGDRTTEAAAARKYAIAKGVPSDSILSEDQSRDTLESIHGVAAVLREHGLSNAVFVSDRPHMLRVLRMAGDAGITAWGSPTKTSPIEADTERPSGRDPPRTWRPRPLFPGRRPVLTGLHPEYRGAATDFPLLAGGVWTRILCQNPPLVGSPTSPALAEPRTAPRSPLPRQREGAREAG